MKILIFAFFLLFVDFFVHSKEKIYYCPMHPSYTSNKKGECPICYMDLVLKEETQKDDLLENDNIKMNNIKLSESVANVIGIKTTKIHKKEFIFKLTIPSVVIYEPELYKIIEEYKYNRVLYENIYIDEKPRIKEIIKAIVDKLRLKYGIDEKIVDSLISDGYYGLITPHPVMFAMAYVDEKYIEILSGIGNLKLFFKPYSKEIDAKIVAISNIVDENRKIGIIIKFKNINGAVKHNMYVESIIEKNMGRKLLIPNESFIEYGEKDVIYIKSGDGYAMRIIKTGLSNDKYTEVLEGLNEGDEIVISSNFLIDSEARIKGMVYEHNH